MQNEIYDEKNGLTYMLCGDYYLPELALKDIEPTYGKYGMLRKSYLQEHRKAKYQILLLQGKLVEHLNQIDAEARDREEQLVKQMMEKEGITEKLKRQDNMEWTRGLARLLTFQVLCCIMVLLSMSVPSRTALRRIGFALFLDLTTFSKLSLPVSQYLIFFSLVLKQ